ncbi:NAD-binding protein [Pyronema domesticum]|uniref:Arsenite methyltransferase n=1 Tax=Pyronema omphalodes (strain CBS 100304) TaxID=1076935 RepID=U4LVP3_PYROM|nr:NAD-binding protein [Pyronema domesticum]CCX34737.1 Similar to Arsenite methyltransferase; acc. no. Q9HBK9 [Pyronema omphalodes CBS 100304]
MNPSAPDADPTTLIKTHYTSHIRSQSASSDPHNKAVASAFGYTPHDLASIPSTSNLGVSCGNPLARAGLKEGETLLDLGCGGGLDCFLASPRVGKTGRVVGVDMTASMLELAERNRKLGGYGNVEFLNANITSLPLPSGTADIITSNCTINLVPHAQKPVVFQETFRLLRPGGRLAVSDILAKRDFPEELRNDVGLYVGCVVGASEVREYEKWLREAGYEDIFIIDTEKDLNVYKEVGILDMTDGNTDEGDTRLPEETQTGCCGVTKSTEDRRQTSSDRLADVDLNEYVGAYQIFAIKPDA